LLYVLHGEDDFSRHQALEKIKVGVGDQTALATNTTVLDGQRVTVDQLRAVCEAAPFLAEKRLVIVHGLLERFESRPKPGRQPKGSAGRQDDTQTFTQYMGGIPESTLLILIDGRLKGANPLLRAVSSRARVMAFTPLKEARLRQWIQERVGQGGDSIAPGAVDMLVRFVGGNLWVMAGEIDKLVLYTSGRRIEEADVRRMVSYAQEASVFTMVDAILEFKAGPAEQLLERLLQQGAPPAYLLVMLSRQVRRVVQAKELVGQRRSEAEMMRRLEIPVDFALRRTLDQAAGYSMTRLKEVYHRLLEADLAIKTGRYDPELALNILLADLGQRTGAGG
jgi:DNA polymerase-3 subunit delta